MSYVDSVSLLTRPQEQKKAADELRQRTAKAATENMTGQKHQRLGGMDSGLWHLLGASSTKIDQENIENFCKTQESCLAHYQSLLEILNNDLLEASTTLLTTCTTWDITNNLTALQDTIRHKTESITQTLNTFDTSSGYFFCGSQTDLQPINPLLIEDMCKENSPNLSLGWVPAYFVNGETPNTQLPYTLAFSESDHLQLPLKANDMQDVFSVFHDILSLDPTTAHDDETGLNALKTHLNPALERVKEALLSVSNLRNTFEQQESQAGEKQTISQNRIDELVKTEPVNASLKLYQEEKALEAFMQFLIFSTSLEEKLRNITAPFLQG